MGIDNGGLKYNMIMAREENSQDPILQLTKRELFAAMALQGIIASNRFFAIVRHQEKSAFYSEQEICAIAALNYADSLIMELEKEK